VTAAGTTPLHLSARNGHLDALEALLRAGGDVTSGDKQELTPLHYAAAAGQVPCAVALLRAGASVWQKSRDGLLAEHAADGQGHASLAQALRDIACMRDGADLEGEDRYVAGCGVRLWGLGFRVSGFGFSESERVSERRPVRGWVALAFDSHLQVRG